MTISYHWLNSYLPVTVSPEQLSEILTSTGLEVEHMEHYSNVPGGLKGLLIGEVLEAIPHPGADKLKLTKVNVGEGKILSIVCGAANVAAGQKVVVAPAGSTIYPTGKEPVTMKMARIRGEASEGMICAEDEIGVGAGHEGILVLDPAAVPGSAAASYFQVYEDVRYEIGITPNRMDALSHIGVARDVLAWLSIHQGITASLVIPEPVLPVPEEESTISIGPIDPALCTRYTTLELTGVQVKPSPEWLKQRLLSIGLKPVNNVVDITNFVLHETGQPLHAFDADQIGGQRISVQTLNAGTPFTMLDAREYKLQQDDILICDGDTNPLCLAGIFGGLQSGVNSQTSRLLLESASFHSGHIRRSMLHHGLRTDAAIRFEKGTDVSITRYALMRAAAMMCELAGARVAGSVQDHYPLPVAPRQITLTLTYLQRLSGKNYSLATAALILNNLGFTLLHLSMEALEVEVPSAKLDIHLPCDLVEEIIRIDGLDNIAIPDAIRLSPATETLNDQEQVQEKITAFLTSLGFHEILTNSITNHRLLAPGTEGVVRMLNSLSQELDVMRPSMLLTGLPVVAHNLNRKQSPLRLFEFGKVYRQLAGGSYAEEQRLAIYAIGASVAGWQQPARKPDIYYLKGLLQSIAQRCGLTATRTEILPDQSIQMLTRNKPLARMEILTGTTLQPYGIKQPVAVIDLNFDLLLLACSGQKNMYRELSKYPAVSRDLALVLPRTVRYDEIETVVRSIKNQRLQQIRLFDVYQGDKVGPEQQSLALNFSFSDPAKTLTDEEVEAMMNTLITRFETQLGALIRK